MSNSLHKIHYSKFPLTIRRILKLVHAQKVSKQNRKVKKTQNTMKKTARFANSKIVKVYN